MFDLEVEADRLDCAAALLVETLGGDIIQAVKYLIVENAQLETELRRVRSKVSTGFLRAGGQRG